MVPTKILPALFGAALLFFGSVSMAAEYRADEFLGLDLSKAVLSPKPLGPAAEFAPVPVQAKGDAAKNDHAADAVQMRAGLKAAESKVESKTAQRRGTVVAHTRPEKPLGAAQTRLAHRHSNPLDAQALDTRVQTWPCRSGGICNWKQ
jgi:hypothetical protein